MSNCTETSAISFANSSEPCAHLINLRVDQNDENLQFDNHCYRLHNSCQTLFDKFDTLHVNKLDHVRLTTHAEFFTRINPAECLLCTMVGIQIEVEKMLENVSEITSMRFLSNSYCCNFTFNLIVDHVDDKFFLCGLAITYDKHAHLKLPSDKSFATYFSEHEMNNFLSACRSKSTMLFPCSYFSSKERNHEQSSAPFAPKILIHIVKHKA